ncbi:MAG TPA: hypothetical protein VLE02_01230 [Nitrosarchaeum sp.]|nr:hypothetical protein [Nitrosarchaeum sp.]
MNSNYVATALRVNSEFALNIEEFIRCVNYPINPFVGDDNSRNENSLEHTMLMKQLFDTYKQYQIAFAQRIISGIKCQPLYIGDPSQRYCINVQSRQDGKIRLVLSTANLFPAKNVEVNVQGVIAKFTYEGENMLDVIVGKLARESETTSLWLETTFETLCGVIFGTITYMITVECLHKFTVTSDKKGAYRFTDEVATNFFTAPNATTSDTVFVMTYMARNNFQAANFLNKNVIGNMFMCKSEFEAYTTLQSVCRHTKGCVVVNTLKNNDVDLVETMIFNVEYIGEKFFILSDCLESVWLSRNDLAKIQAKTVFTIKYKKFQSEPKLINLIASYKYRAWNISGSVCLCTDIILFKYHIESLLGKYIFSELIIDSN